MSEISARCFLFVGNISATICKNLIFKIFYLVRKVFLICAKSDRKQCFVLAEILKIIHSNVVTGDLSFIGESKKSGVVSTNSVLSEVKGVKSIYLVHQSVTGLFEKKIDLLNM